MLHLWSAQVTDAYCNRAKEKEFTDHTLFILHYQRKCYLAKRGGGIQLHKTAVGWCSRNQYTHLSNVKRMCMKQKSLSWISHTCQARYLVLTHAIFDIYLQSWGNLQFTSAITMYDSSAVCTGLTNKCHIRLKTPSILQMLIINTLFNGPSLFCFE